MKFFNRFKRDNFHTLKVGNGIYSVKIPSKYLWEYEEEILAFYPKGDETITIRVSLLTFQKNDATNDDFLTTVIEEAKLESSAFEYLDKETLLVENLPKVTTEDSTDLIIQTWYVAKDKSLIVFTATIILKFEHDKSVLETKQDLEQIIRSVQIVN